MTLVSIIIPVYNTAQYLKRCLDSIINQTLEDIEIICINDGSTDNSPQVLQEYAAKDNRIKLINQENQGLSCTRNNGMNLASGEYIGFVDSDDWIERDFYEKLYQAAQKYDADIAAAGILQNNGERSKPFLRIKKEQTAHITEEKYKLCNIPRRCHVWNKIYRRKPLLDTGLKFPPKRIFEDIVWSHIVIDKLNKLVTVPNTYYFYYETRGSISKKFDQKHEEDLRFANHECMEYIRRNHIKVNYKHYSADKRVLFKSFGIRFLDIKIWEHLVLIHIMGIPVLQIHSK